MLLQKAYKIFREDGLREVLERTKGYIQYRVDSFYFSKIRPVFPMGGETVQYNGIVTQPYRIIDPFVPIKLPPNKGGHKLPSEYEHGLSDGLRKNVKSGDDVVIIGGGIGVTAIIAAQETGPSGSVVVYEGAENMVKFIQETIRLNDVPCPIDIRHSVVGSDKGLHGQPGGASHVSINEIPECDVLEMDCEGAEAEILESMDNRPRCIIVETHRNRSQVETLLRGAGYHILSGNVAEVGPYESRCKEHEIFVLTASI
jgi:hypothetical protein